MILPKANYILSVFTAVYLLQFFVSLWLDKLNREYTRERGGNVPDLFKDVIDKDKLRESSAYNLSKSQLAQSREIISELMFLGIVLSGSLPFLDFMSRILQGHYVVSGVLFFLVIGLVSFMLNLPFDYYDTFMVEGKYGFNQSTLGLWISDNIKEGILSVIFMFFLLSPVLWLIRTFPDNWWIYSFVVVSIVQVIITIIYPVLIAPIFNKFEPLEDRDLAEKVMRLMEKEGIKVKDILQMDAGKRSRHTNAYFTGLGKTKRIVFYDTLVKSHTHEEILAILAHEAGHYKEKHIIKQLILFEVFSLWGFYLTNIMIHLEIIPDTFNLSPSQQHITLLLIVVFWEKLFFFLKPFHSALSRHFERQADLFSIKLIKTSKPMVDGLKKMAADNLANLSPHPLYVKFHYSHPPLVERVDFLIKAGLTSGEIV